MSILVFRLSVCLSITIFISELINLLLPAFWLAVLSVSESVPWPFYLTVNLTEIFCFFLLLLLSQLSRSRFLSIHSALICLKRVSTFGFPQWQCFSPCTLCFLQVLYLVMSWNFKPFIPFTVLDCSRFTVLAGGYFISAKSI